jgi:hypothetical protein
MPSAEPQTEQWVYAGLRIDNGGKKRYAWIDPAGRERWFSKGAAHHVIGAAYDVHVTYNDDRCTRHGDPTFARAADHDDPKVAEYEAADRIAKTHLASRQRERNAARTSALDEAIVPLERIAAHFVSGADLDALTAYVTRRIHSAYFNRSRR